jgi:hypothetical protein
MAPRVILIISLVLVALSPLIAFRRGTKDDYYMLLIVPSCSAAVDFNERAIHRAYVPFQSVRNFS